MTKGESDAIEKVQKRCLKVIYPNRTYQEATQDCKVQTLYERRETLCKKLFTSMKDPSHRLHDLLSPKKPHTYFLRSPVQYVIPDCQTERYKKSFLPYCLRHYQ